MSVSDSANQLEPVVPNGFSCAKMSNQCEVPRGPVERYIFFFKKKLESVNESDSCGSKHSRALRPSKPFRVPWTTAITGQPGSPVSFFRRTVEAMKSYSSSSLVLLAALMQTIHDFNQFVTNELQDPPEGAEEVDSEIPFPAEITRIAEEGYNSRRPLLGLRTRASQEWARLGVNQPSLVTSTSTTTGMQASEEPTETDWNIISSSEAKNQGDQTPRAKLHE